MIRFISAVLFVLMLATWFAEAAEARVIRRGGQRAGRVCNGASCRR